VMTRPPALSRAGNASSGTTTVAPHH